MNHLPCSALLCRLVPSLALLLPLSVSAQQFGSPAYCNQLADIGAKTFDARRDGHPLSAVLATVTSGLAGQPAKRDAAQGVVVLVYNDRSITSAGQAYRTVYSVCTK